MKVRRARRSLDAVGRKRTVTVQPLLVEKPGRLRQLPESKRKSPGFSPSSTMLLTVSSPPPVLIKLTVAVRLVSATRTEPKFKSCGVKKATGRGVTVGLVVGVRVGVRVRVGEGVAEGVGVSLAVVVGVAETVAVAVAVAEGEGDGVSVNAAGIEVSVGGAGEAVTAGAIGVKVAVDRALTRRRLVGVAATVSLTSRRFNEGSQAEPSQPIRINSRIIKEPSKPNTGQGVPAAPPEGGGDEGDCGGGPSKRPRL